MLAERSQARKVTTLNLNRKGVSGHRLRSRTVSPIYIWTKGDCGFRPQTFGNNIR